MKILSGDSILGRSFLIAMMLGGCTELKPDESVDSGPREEDPPVIQPGGNDEPEGESESEDPPTIHLLGDSAMSSQFNRPQAGWGEYLARSLSSLEVKNLAGPNYSTKNFFFRADRWEAARDDIAAGDYVLIQFGNADQRAGDEFEASGTYAFCSDGTNDGEGCADLSTSYYAILKAMIQEVISKEATPILITPTARGQFEPGTDRLSALGTHNVRDANPEELHPRGNYPEAMRALAATYEEQVALIDMTEESKRVLEVCGSDVAQNLYVSPNGTELLAPWAEILAKVVSRAIRDDPHPAFDRLREYVITEPFFMVVPDNLSIGNQPLSFTSFNKLAIIAYDAVEASSESGLIRVEASGEGLSLSLSDDENAEPESSSIDVRIDDAEVLTSVFAQFSAEGELGPSEGTVTFRPTRDTLGVVEIPFDVRTVDPEEGTPFSVSWLNETTDQRNIAVVEGPMNATDVAISNLTVDRGTSLELAGNAVPVTRFEVQNTDRTGDIYCGFSITPPAAVRLDEISVFMTTSGGSNVVAEIEYSLSPDFSQVIPLQEGQITFAAQNVMEFFSFPITSEGRGQGEAVGLDRDQTLYFRIYPFNRVEGTGDYLAVYDIKVTGEVVVQ